MCFHHLSEISSAILEKTNRRFPSMTIDLFLEKLFSLSLSLAFSLDLKILFINYLPYLFLEHRRHLRFVQFKLSFSSLLSVGVARAAGFGPPGFD